jgi:amino acid transporter
MDAKVTTQSDDSVLARFGYKPQLDRVLGLFGDFSLGYSYMSPVAGFYALFAFAMTTAGPSFFWTMPIVLIGQMLVAMVFAEASSQFPIAGGVYQWARHLGGARWGFLTAWVYLLALLGTIAALGVGVGPFVASLFGFAPTPALNGILAIALVVAAGATNLMGTRILARATELGVWTGLGGLLICGVYLLLFGRIQPVSVLWESFGAGDENRTGALFAASLIGIWIFFGHEACGDLAEEVKDASHQVPRAMLLTMICGGGSALLIALGMILAVPDMNAAVGGTVNPAEAVLTNAFGAFGAKLMLVILVAVVYSATVSVIASASRLLFSLARDNAIFASAGLSSIPAGKSLPTNAVIVATIVPSLILLLGVFSPDAVTITISFATAAIYTAFTMVVIAALGARSRGWVPSGPYKIGALGWLVSLLGLIWGLIAILNICWPRPAAPDASIWMTYLIPISLALIFALGIVQMGSIAKQAGADSNT